MYVRRINLAGQRFHRLLVLDRLQSYTDPSGHKRTAYNCICDCGCKKIIRADHLYGGVVKSCGCQKIDSARVPKYRTPIRDAIINQVHTDYRVSARQRGLEFSLTKEELGALILSNCAYCGIKPRPRKSRTSREFSYNGIDRVNSEMGYTIDNVVSCCWECNRAKSDMTRDQYLELVSRVYQHNFGARK